MAHVRRKARIAALQALFESDSSGHDPFRALEWIAAERSLPDEALSYARDLINGVIKNRDRLDSTIEAYAPSWPVNQLSPVDRNILRLAIYEILMENKVPLKAAINEAVELAKIFGSNNSSRFINGVLGSIGQIQVNSR
ncbi:MAG: transcription antitermination factor NusB [Dehalococcoidia bacterium]|nr:transcription antitermination factor NusB [Dehalococcoidia bacterium]